MRDYRPPVNSSEFLVVFKSDCKTRRADIVLILLFSQRQLTIHLQLHCVLVVLVVIKSDLALS